MKKFNQVLSEDEKLRVQLEVLISPTCSCKQAEICVVRRRSSFHSPSYLSNTHGDVGNGSPSILLSSYFTPDELKTLVSLQIIMNFAEKPGDKNSCENNCRLFTKPDFSV